MRTGVRVCAIAFLCAAACRGVVDFGPFACAADTPTWLRDRLEAIAEPFGVSVYRYEWRGDPVYHIQIPISSCAYCELYDGDGDPMQFGDEAEFQDFLVNKAGETVVCEWKG